MYNLYQSDLRTSLRKRVYNEEMIDIQLRGKKYIWTRKIKKIWPLTLSWLQIMWVQLPDDRSLIPAEIQRIKKKYTDRRIIHIQLWCTNILAHYDNAKKSPKPDTEHVRQERQSLRSELHSFWLRHAFRSNMPDANIVYDVTKTSEELLNDMHSNSKQWVRKAIRHELVFDVATPDEYGVFYDKWKELSWLKWFNIISRETFDLLVEYIVKHKCGDMFLARYGETIVSWSLCLYMWETVVYLYGFLNRDKEVSRLWWHPFLKYRIFEFVRDNKWLKHCDSMGWAATWDKKSALASVARYKQSLWWKTVDYYGSYDIVLNPLLYKLFSMRSK